MHKIRIALVLIALVAITTSFYMPILLVSSMAAILALTLGEQGG